MRGPKRTGIEVVAAVLAVLALTAGSAAAKPVLQLSADHTVLKGGAALEFEAFPEVTVETTSGGLECPTIDERNGLLGSLLGNNSRKDQIKVTEAVGTLAGGSCASSIPAFGAAAIFSIASSGGEIATLTLASNQTALFNGGSGTYVELGFPETGTHCIFRLGNMHGTFKLGSPIDLTFSGQPIKLARKREDSPLCPTTAQLSVRFSNAFHPEGGGESSPLEVKLG